jgi:hypothetical protein
VSYKKTGLPITPEIKSYDWLKPNLKPSLGGARDTLTFKRTRHIFEEQEIQSKVCFRAKISKKKYFFTKGFNFNIQTWFPGWYFTSTNSKNFLGNSPIQNITQVWTCRKKLRTLTPEKTTLKLLYVLETRFVLNFKYCWKFLAFLLVEIQLFSAQKQMSFRRRTYMPYTYMAAIMSDKWLKWFYWQLLK